MTRKDPDTYNKLIWDELVNSYIEYSDAMRKFFASDINRITLIRQGINKPGGTVTALHIARFLSQSERQALLSEWIRFACMSDSYAEAAREIIISLPKEWLLANIEAEAEPFLSNGSYTEYSLILTLYSELDENLANRLALRAAHHPNYDISEIGQDWLDTAGKEDN